MSDDHWFKFFQTCAIVLGPGSSNAEHSESWCAWTTFDSLEESVRYWSAGLPRAEEFGSHATKDGGAWQQPFSYQSLAHVVIPRRFHWEATGVAGFRHGTKVQDIERLSRELTHAGVEHRLTELVLEIKRY